MPTACYLNLHRHFKKFNRVHSEDEEKVLIKENCVYNNDDTPKGIVTCFNVASLIS